MASTSTEIAKKSFKLNHQRCMPCTCAFIEIPFKRRYSKKRTQSRKHKTNSKHTVQCTRNKTAAFSLSTALVSSSLNRSEGCTNRTQMRDSRNIWIGSMASTTYDQKKYYFKIRLRKFVLTAMATLDRWSHSQAIHFLTYLCLCMEVR